MSVGKEVSICCVQTSGNDIFYRNPANVNENLFVDVSSPSSSAFASVEDLGTPDQAAKKTLNQVLCRTCLMSLLAQLTTQPNAYSTLKQSLYAVAVLGGIDVHEAGREAERRGCGS